jgi:PilZ domain
MNNATAIDVAERRHTERVVRPVRVFVDVLTPAVCAQVINLSWGGLLIRTPLAFTIGAIHSVRLTIDRQAFVVRARVVHATLVTREGPPSVVCGLEFVDRGGPEGERALQSVIESSCRPDA